MAGRPRKPLEINKRHFTQAEKEQRQAETLNVPFKDVAPPECLTTKKQVAEFSSIADKLLKLDIFTELDVDALARYIISKGLYLDYTKKLKTALNRKDFDIKEVEAIQRMQDKAFRQTVTSANELCLNISSRCKLVIPPPPEDDDDEL